MYVVLGYGPTGRALTKRLIAEDKPVRVVTRTGRAKTPSGVHVTAADIADPDAAKRACAGAEVVFSCVGMDYRNWPQRWPAMMAGMLEGAQAAQARFVFMDNLYMYGPVDGPLAETLPLTDYGSKPATRAKITRMWQEAHEAGRVQAAAVRASDFYGPHVSMAALGEYTFGAIAAGKPANCVGDVDLPHSFTYVPDIARALMSVAEARDAMGQAWHVPNAPDTTVRDLLTKFAGACQKKLKVRTMPAWMLSLLGLFNANMREMKEMQYQWTRPFQVDHRKFAARFWSDATPFEDGIRATAAWYTSRTS